MNWKSKAECEARAAEAPSPVEIVDRLRYACERLYEECHKPFADEMAVVIEDAIAVLSAVSVPGKVALLKRPTAFLIRYKSGEYDLFGNEELAAAKADENGVEYVGLYERTA